MVASLGFCTVFEMPKKTFVRGGGSMVQPLTISFEICMDHWVSCQILPVPSSPGLNKNQAPVWPPQKRASFRGHGRGLEAQGAGESAGWAAHVLVTWQSRLRLPRGPRHRGGLRGGPADAGGGGWCNVPLKATESWTVGGRNKTCYDMLRDFAINIMQYDIHDIYN